MMITCKGEATKEYRYQRPIVACSIEIMYHSPLINISSFFTQGVEHEEKHKNDHSDKNGHWLKPAHVIVELSLKFVGLALKTHKNDRIA
jgi:hypothetical protein